MAKASTIWRSQYRAFIASLNPREFTSKEYQLDPDKRPEIKEFCDIIHISKKEVLKLYSSIEKRTERSRSVGRDSIKVVAADSETLEPIRKRNRKVYRVEGWRNNLQTRIAEATCALGYNTECKCGALMFLRRNQTNGSLFLSCSKDGHFTRSLKK